MRSSPSSFQRPGPTARTSPSWGFSLAVYGMTRPDAVVCSASTDLTTMRSSSGLMETDTIVTSPLGMSEWTDGLLRSDRAQRRRGGRRTAAALALGEPECQWPNLGPGLALGQLECQTFAPSGTATPHTRECRAWTSPCCAG